MNTEERIVEGAGDLFFSHGIRTITMDDIASALRMSKKTIYQYFRDKNLLVQALTERELKLQLTDMNEIRNSSENPIVEILKLMEYLGNFFKRVNPTLFYDLQKYHPHAWYSFKTFKENEMIGFVEENLKQGIRQKLYRDTIDTKIIARLRIEEVELGFNPRAFPPETFNISDVQLNLLDHFLHGIVSKSGFETINNFRNKRKEPNN